MATRRRRGRSSRKELRRTVAQGDTDTDGLHPGGRREHGWTPVLYTSYRVEACTIVVCWAVRPLAGKTTDWRAGCGRSASPVRREGAAIAASYPYPAMTQARRGRTLAVGSAIRGLSGQ